VPDAALLPDAEVERRNRWNFLANVFDGTFFAFGMSFVSQQTILPVIVKNIGGGNIAVGLIPVIWTLGFNFPQMLIIPLARRTGKKKALFLKTAFIQRVPWFLLLLASLFVFDRVTPDAALIVFFVLYGLSAVGGSLNLPVWFDLLARLTPVKRRGRLFGIRSVLGSLLGIGGGAIAGVVLGRYDPPVSYSILFGLSLAALMVSYGFLLTLREPQAEAAKTERHNAARLRPMDILRQNKNLRRFIVADALQYSANMGMAFFAVYALRRFSLTDASAGLFTAVMMGSLIAGSLIFGPLADRFGHKLNLMVAAGATILSSVVALVAPTPVIYSVVFVGVALSTGLVNISRLPLLAEIAGESDRSAIMAVANTCSSPFIFWGVFGGMIADKAGFEWVFILSGLFALAGMLWLQKMVVEPRTAMV
jgi:MFS family permease